MLARRKHFRRVEALDRYGSHPDTRKPHGGSHRLIALPQLYSSIENLCPVWRFLQGRDLAAVQECLSGALKHHLADTGWSQHKTKREGVAIPGTTTAFLAACV